MKLSEYAQYDGLGLAALIREKEITPGELAALALEAIEKINPQLRAVIETYPDRTGARNENDLPPNLDHGLDHDLTHDLAQGPFFGVPFLIKDIGGHEAGRKIEFGSRLCKDMVSPQNSHVGTLFQKAGLNIIGRTNTPEFSLTGSAENLLYGNTSTPWKAGLSAGGSSGGAMASVMAGLVPLAHGSDIAGSIRIPASWCGGIGLKPSRGRVSAGPQRDETGFGLAANLVQTKTMRDTAAMLDCLALPQTGDPFLIPKPRETYTALLGKAPQKLRIGWSAAPPLGFAIAPEIAPQLEQCAHILHELGHEVSEAALPSLPKEMFHHFLDLWLVSLGRDIDLIAQKMQRPINEDTLEPATLQIYHYAKSITASALLNSLAQVNMMRRAFGAFFDEYDICLTPTIGEPPAPHGRYSLQQSGQTIDSLIDNMWGPLFQFTYQHNVMGTPALSLPLGQYSSGLPLGMQFAARPAQEHILLQLGAALEEAMPWRERIPPIHASRL